MKVRRLCQMSAVVIVAIGLYAGASTALADEASESVYQQFDEISALRANGQFDEAIANLQQLIEEHTRSEDILRRAYSDLALTIFFQRSAAGDATERDRLSGEIEKQIRTGLARFPDLSPEQGSPPDLKRMFSDMRAQMFGSLSISTDPDSCEVYLGDEKFGKAPVKIDLFPVGVYALTVSKSGYKDESSELRVIANSSIDKEVSLSRERTTNWWVTRVVLPVAAGVGVVLALTLSGQDDGGTQPDQPLPGPPGTPTQ